jgi:hypothetical protein
MQTGKKRVSAGSWSRGKTPARGRLIDSDLLPRAGVPPTIADGNQGDHGYGWDLYTRPEEEAG